MKTKRSSSQGPAKRAARDVHVVDLLDHPDRLAEVIDQALAGQAVITLGREVHFRGPLLEFERTAYDKALRTGMFVQYPKFLGEAALNLHALHCDCRDETQFVLRPMDELGDFPPAEGMDARDWTLEAHCPFAFAYPESVLAFAVSVGLMYTRTIRTSYLEVSFAQVSMRQAESLRASLASVLNAPDRLEEIKDLQPGRRGRR